MEAGGFEPTSLALSRTPISDTPGAKSDARHAPGVAPIIEDHPELTKLIQAWPDLAPELRTAILRMISK